MPHSESLAAFLKMARQNAFVVLDTETTGLNGEICQIAVIDCAGTVLLNTLVKPTTPIPAGATAVHGITDADVAGAPTWTQISFQVEKLLTGRQVIVYNAGFDQKMLVNSEARAGLITNWYEIGEWWCAMEAFAEIYGEWSSYHQNYHWQQLSTAARHYRLSTNGAHDALGDCLMTLGVVQAMAKAAML